MYYARLNTDEDPMAGISTNSTNRPQQRSTREGAATVTVTVAEGGSSGILALNPGPTDLAYVEGSLGILSFENCTTDLGGVKGSLSILPFRTHQKPPNWT